MRLACSLKSTQHFGVFEMRQSLPALLLFVVVLAMSAPPAAAASDADAAGSQSMRMYRDPETGAVGRPSAAALQAEAAPAQPEPSAEEPVQAAAGGVKVNLRGSHRPAVMRYADPGAPARHECVDTGGVQ
jgi:hypothetical protein